MFKRKHCLPLIIWATGLLCANAQNVDVDVNMNIKHSVDGISDFGRERHITAHTTPTETDWDGEEDKLDYFINDLDVYFGRDNGSATWKFQATEEDPDRPNHPDLEWLEGFGTWLKDEYNKDQLARQYENKGAMIMGTNPHPVYPTLSWYPNGSTWTGWQPQDVETSAEWVVNYLDYAFRKNMGENGEPLPEYWEVVNEIDMEFMTGKLCFTSYEDIWRYHNLIREGLRERLGEYAPKVGGMTWGQHDLTSGDGLGRMSVETALSYGVNPDAVETEFEPYYKDNWFQWDILFQGFMDACPDMDFWSIHFYDWPQSTVDQGVRRSGGPVEATLDMIEWYDNYKFGEPKELIVSEFGAVSGYIDNVSVPRKAWENIRPFNNMFMQFLERPSHITLTMPFVPAKAEWGDIKDENGNVITRYPSILLDKDANGEWQWTDFLLWYEQWSEVKGTRVETKSTDLDIQVDAYSEGNHLYLILNSQQHESAQLNLNLFGAGNNTVENVQIRNLYFDASRGVDGEPVYEVKNFKTPPGSITIDPEATIILDYTFANSVTINETVNEEKYMSETLESGNTVDGRFKFRKEVSGRTPLTTQINNVTVPSGAAEAVLRIGGKFWDSEANLASVTINGHELDYNNDFRGDLRDGRNYWFGVHEVPVPKEYLKANNTITCTVNHNVTYTTAMLQVFDFSVSPKRGADGDQVALTGITAADNEFSLMEDQTRALDINFTPENATNKTLVWSSSATDVVTVDQMGIVKAVASSGSAVITATSEEGGYTANVTVNAVPYQATPVSGISISEGANLDVEYFVTSPLHLEVSPAGATSNNVEWSSSNPDAVSVDPTTGKVTGKVIGAAATITATLTDEHNGNAIHEASVDVSVGIQGEETIYANALPHSLNGNTLYSIEVPVNINGARTIVLELLKNGSEVLGSETVSVNDLGRVTVTADLSLSALPQPGTNYSWRTTLKDGATILDEGASDLEILDIIHVESVSINETYPEIEVEETRDLSITILPETAYNKNVTWSSTQPSVVSVNSDGQITGHATGSATITVETEDGSISDQITITVVNQYANGPDNIIIPSEITVFPNSSYAFSESYEPSTLPESQKGVTWSSSNPSMAAVSAEGIVTTGSVQGNATITATSTIDNSIVATCDVSVATILNIEAENYDNMGGSVGEIGITDIPGGQGINNVQKGDFVEFFLNIPMAGEYEVTFTAATNVADGVVEFIVDGDSKGSVQVTQNGWDSYGETGLGSTVVLPEGNVTIKILASGSSDWQWNMDKFSLSYLGESFDGIEISRSSLSLEEGSTSTLSATVTINGTENTNVNWSSNATAVATVNSNGVVTAVSTGNAIVTATSTDNSALQATCSVTVVEQGSSFIIEAEDLTTTGGTYDDSGSGGPGFGMNISAIGVNYVNSGDWAEYDLSVPADGVYEITYYISTPSDNAEISCYIDGGLISTDAVTNNGQWDDYHQLTASGTASLPAGDYTLKIEASGSHTWQWNLDKIELSKVSPLRTTGIDSKSADNVKIFPNPVSSVLYIQIDNPEVYETLQLISYTGKVLMTETLQADVNKGRIDVSSLERGMYIIKLSGKKTRTISFIRD